jgi:hypothetical protein
LSHYLCSPSPCCGHKLYIHVPLSSPYLHSLPRFTFGFHCRSSPCLHHSFLSVSVTRAKPSRCALDPSRLSVNVGASRDYPSATNSGHVRAQLCPQPGRSLATTRTRCVESNRASKPLATTPTLASDDSCSALKPCVEGSRCSQDGTFPTISRRR